MPNKNGSHHVVPDPDGGWNVKKGGSNKSYRHYDTKKEAKDVARKVSKNQGTELVIHKKDGSIQNADSHGNDPNPPKDKK